MFDHDGRWLGDHCQSRYPFHGGYSSVLSRAGSQTARQPQLAALIARLARLAPELIRPARQAAGIVFPLGLWTRGRDDKFEFGKHEMSVVTGRRLVSLQG